MDCMHHLPAFHPNMELLERGNVQAKTRRARYHLASQQVNAQTLLLTRPRPSLKTYRLGYKSYSLSSAPPKRSHLPSRGRCDGSKVGTTLRKLHSSARLQARRAPIRDIGHERLFNALRLTGVADHSFLHSCILRYEPAILGQTQNLGATGSCKHGVLCCHYSGGRWL